MSRALLTPMFCAAALLTAASPAAAQLPVPAPEVPPLPEVPSLPLPEDPLPPPPVPVPVPVPVPPAGGVGGVVPLPDAGDLLAGGGGGTGTGPVTPPPVLLSLLNTLTPGGGGASPSPSSPGSQTGPTAGAPVAPATAGPAASADTVAPSVGVAVASRLRSGRLALRVRASEPGVVVVGVFARPGARRRGVARRVRVSRRLMKPPAVVLAFRQAGSLTASLKLTPAQRRTLGRVRNARLSIAVLAVDVARNQSTLQVRRRVRR